MKRWRENLAQLPRDQGMPSRKNYSRELFRKSKNDQAATW